MSTVLQPIDSLCVRATVQRAGVRSLRAIGQFVQQPVDERILRI